VSRAKTRTQVRIQALPLLKSFAEGTGTRSEGGVTATKLTVFASTSQWAELERRQPELLRRDRYGSRSPRLGAAVRDPDGAVIRLWASEARETGPLNPGGGRTPVHRRRRIRLRTCPNNVR
jgi:hypothetical protein